MEGQFAVVHFLNENAVDAVRINWISADKKWCKWPNANEKKSIKNLKKKSALPGENWTDCSVRVLGSYESYEIARSKCKLAEVTSDLDSGTAGRRAASSQSADHFNLVNLQPPTAPVYSAAYVETLDGVSTEGVECPITIVQDSSQISALAAASEEFQKISIQNQELLKAELNETKQLLLSVLAQSNAPTTSANLFPLLPVCENSELDSLEEWLKISANFSSMVKVLSRIGGSSAAKIVYNILSHVFSHEISKQLRLTKKSGKTAVCELKITKAIVEAALSSNGVDLSEKQVTTHIGIWFRSVEDRKGGRSARKNRQHQPAQPVVEQNGDSIPNENETN